MKLVKALAVLALVLAIAVPAYAETQNVKVSGSLDMFAFYRANYDLNKDEGDAMATGMSPDSEFLMSQVQVEVAADLTDNVSTVINLINERNWNESANADADNFDVALDLAYVQMKEIFYSPLTVTIGRQDIWFGRGFIIGSNNTMWDQQGTISANEYSVQTAFDAIRATLDFNPWTIDLVYSKIDEGGVASEDDTDLYVVNVNYKFAEYNAVAEGYFVSQWNRLNVNSAAGENSNDTETIGGRIQFDPISQITLGAELAYQWGDYDQSGIAQMDRSAWACDIFGTYRWDMTWKPELTVEYVMFSGTENGDSDYSSWNALYRGKFWTAYNDFRQFVYTTDDTGDVPATTNEQFIQVKGALKPLEDLLLEGSFTYIWNAEDVYVAGANRDAQLGYEFDLQATYDYTEDVSFGVLAAWFVPGDFYLGPNDATATDLVGSVKVTF